jgi:hypothetical protein
MLTHQRISLAVCAVWLIAALRTNRRKHSLFFAFAAGEQWREAWRTDA